MLMGSGKLPGERVNGAATGGEVVVTVALLQVAFPSGTIWIHPEELENLSKDPAERLAGGELCHAESYALPVQGCG
jgi:hypothetical protein